MKSGRDVRKGCSMSLIIFNLHNEYLTKEALEGSGSRKKNNTQCEICRYLVLLAKKETVLQGMIERPTETRMCCGMEMNVGRKWESQGNHPQYRLW